MYEVACSYVFNIPQLFSTINGFAVTDSAVAKSAVIARSEATKQSLAVYEIASAQKARLAMTKGDPLSFVKRLCSSPAVTEAPPHQAGHVI
jgi:hypothetical protein